MPDYECHICRTKMWWKNRIDPVCPKCDPEKAGIKSFNDQTACKELVDKTGRTELAPMIQSVLDENIKLKSAISRMADENIEFKEQLTTVTAQRDLLKDALEKLFSWVDAYAETSDTEFPAVERLCVEALASLKGE